MKVCFINIYQEKSLRGAETFVSKVSENLGKTLSVKVISGKRTLPNRWPFLWRIYLDPQGILILLYTLSLLPEIWREKYDVIVPANGGWMPVIVRIVTWLYGGKMIVSGQSGQGWDERINLWCFPNTFVALTDVTKKWAMKINPYVRSITIPNGVDVKNFYPVGKKIKTGLKHPVVLCVAALEKAKRINLVIEAISKTSNFSLFLAGNQGDSYNEIISLGKKLLGNRFRYQSLPHFKMPDVYRSADIFTLVSESYFSFEIAIVEAMATGLPVVVNDDPIRHEIVESNGYYVDPTNIESYAKKLEEVYANRKKYIISSLKRSKEFDWKNISDKYLDLISNITKNV